MNYNEIVKAIEAYDKMTSAEVQEVIAPIIKVCDKKALSEYLGISVHSIYQYCRKHYVINDMKPEFVTYAKLMAIDMENFSATAWMDKISDKLNERAQNSSMISFKQIANECGCDVVTIKHTKEIMNKFLTENPEFIAIQTMAAENNSLFNSLHFMKSETNATEKEEEA